MRKLISLLLSAALILLFSGCAGSSSTPTEEPTQPIQQIQLQLQQDLRPYLGVELTMLTMAGETDPEADVLRQAAAAFMNCTEACIAITASDAEHSIGWSIFWKRPGFRAASAAEP